MTDPTHRHSNPAALTRLKYVASPTNQFLKDDFTWTTVTPYYIEHNFVSITDATYQLTTTMTYVNADATGASTTITLPGSPPSGTTLNIKKVDSTANTVTVLAAPTVIENAATAVLTIQFESITIIYDGTYWWVI